jgi:hypothetical protein
MFIHPCDKKQERREDGAPAVGPTARYPLARACVHPTLATKTRTSRGGGILHPTAKRSQWLLLRGLCFHCALLEINWMAE